MMKFFNLDLVQTRVLNALVVLLLFWGSSQVEAQSLRDPTLPPVEAGLSDKALSGASASADSESGAMTVIVRNGRPFLAVGTRLYATGQKLGQARIERITETEIWLREGGVLRKVAQFSGIQRRVVPAVVAKPVCTSTSSKSPSSLAPCAGVSP